MTDLFRLVRFFDVFIVGLAEILADSSFMLGLPYFHLQNPDKTKKDYCCLPFTCDSTLTKETLLHDLLAPPSLYRSRAFA
jgi:hypothetical protein